MRLTEHSTLLIKLEYSGFTNAKNKKPIFSARSSNQQPKTARVDAEAASNNPSPPATLRPVAHSCEVWSGNVDTPSNQTTGVELSANQGTRETTLANQKRGEEMPANLKG